MKMQQRLLDASGSIQWVTNSVIQRCVQVPIDCWLDDPDLKSALALAETAIVDFPSVADGRGFSVAAELRGQVDFRGQLLAAGKINPDQMSLAFQCGFDGVIIDDESWIRYGEAAWTDALSPVVTSSYLRYNWQYVGAIWDIRRCTNAGPRAEHNTGVNSGK